MNITTRAFPAGAFALAATVGLAHAQPVDGYYGHAMMGGGWWFLGPIMMIVFIALIVGAIVLVLRLSGVGATPKAADRSLEILKERFARGELDKAEFEDRRKVLGA